MKKDIYPMRIYSENCIVHQMVKKKKRVEKALMSLSIGIFGIQKSYL